MELLALESNSIRNALVENWLSHAQTVFHFNAGYLLRLDEEASEWVVLASYGAGAPSPRVRIALPAEGLETAGETYFTKDAWRHAWLLKLPRFQYNGYESAAVIPLRWEARPSTLAVFARTEQGEGEWNGLTSHALERFGLSALAAALSSIEENEQLREEVRRLNEKLAGRIAIEKAKGLLQRRLTVDEEQAYRYLRLISRQKRRPIHEIAGELLNGPEKLANLFPAA